MADDLITIYERDTQRRSRPASKEYKELRGRRQRNHPLHSPYPPTDNHYYRSMSNNASTLDTQQMHTDGSNTSTKIQSPQTTLSTSLPNEATDTIVDCHTVFTARPTQPPFRSETETAPLLFCPNWRDVHQRCVAPQAKTELAPPPLTRTERIMLLSSFTPLLVLPRPRRTQPPASYSDSPETSA